MKQSIFLSFFIHITLLGLAMQIFSGSRNWPKTPPMYQVELISIEQFQSEIRHGQKQARAASSLKTETAPKKAVNTPPAAEEKKSKPSPEELKRDQSPVQEAPVQSSATKLMVDQKEFPFAYYLNLLHSRLQENWLPPYQMDQRSQPLKVGVVFRILRDGEITDLAVESTSGRFVFDRAALRAVLAIKPLPPLPGEFGKEYLSVHIEFEEKRQ